MPSRRSLSPCLLLALLAGCAADPATDGISADLVLPRCGAPAGLPDWNDDATWTGNPATGPVWVDAAGALGVGRPESGAVVLVGANVEVVLDGTPTNRAGAAVDLGGLAVRGALYADCSDLALAVDWIDVGDGGHLQIGSPTDAYSGDAVITLTDRHPDPPGLPAGTPLALRVAGGVLDLHGADQGSAWVLLRSPAAGGTSDLPLDRAVPWASGSRVVVASTDFEPGQAEPLVVDSLGGAPTTLRSRTALAHGHWGGTVGAAPYTVDESAEVILLSRNLRVVRDAAAPARAQMRFEPGAAAPLVRMAWVEVQGLGERGVMATYPIHFHHVGDASASYVRHTSVHDSDNRAIVVHRTDNLEVTGNVTYDIVGHTFYLEEGNEEGNQLIDNVAVVTLPNPDTADELRVGDEAPASFYITNPSNHFVGNRAAGSAAYGFYFFCLTPAPADGGCGWPVPLEFTGNVAHSNRYNGLDLDTFEDAAGNSAHPRWVCTAADPRDCEPARFTSFTAFKNGQYGVWLRTHGTVGPQAIPTILSDARLADNRSGFYLASGGWQQGDDSLSIVRDSVVIGESENTGNPDAQIEIDLGRSLPNVVPACTGCVRGSPLAWSEPAQAIAGYEIYDGLFLVEDTHFARFASITLPGGAFRPAGAFSPTHPVLLGVNHDDNPWAIDPRNAVRALTFDAANPVWMRPLQHAGESGAATAVLRDLDGSITGIAGGWVTAGNRFLHPAAAPPAPDPATRAYAVGAQQHYAQLQVFDDTLANPVGYLWLTNSRNGAQQLIRSPELDPDRFGLQLLAGTPTTGPATYQLALYGHAPRCTSGATPAACGLTAVAPGDARHLRLMLALGQAGDTVTISLPYPVPPAVTFTPGTASTFTYDSVAQRLSVTLSLPPGSAYAPLRVTADIDPL